jgi:hypothetical protein
MHNKPYDGEFAARTIYAVLKSNGSKQFKVHPVFRWLALNTVWMEVLVPTKSDSDTDEPVHVYAKIRPRWYWLLKCIMLFLSIVGRRVHGKVWITPRKAWGFARMIYPKDEIMR